MAVQLLAILHHVWLLNVQLMFKMQLYNKLHRQSWSCFPTSTIVLIHQYLFYCQIQHSYGVEYLHAKQVSE